MKPASAANSWWASNFMRDCGYLWQITVWPEDCREAERAMAANYFRNDLVHVPVRIKAGYDRHPDRPVAVELYDRQNAPDENVNIAADKSNAALLKQLPQQWRDGWCQAVPHETLN